MRRVSAAAYIESVLHIQLAVAACLIDLQHVIIMAPLYVLPACCALLVKDRSHSFASTSPAFWRHVDFQVLNSPM